MPTDSTVTACLSELQIHLVARHEKSRYKELIAQHHYLGDLAKIGETR